MKKATTKRKMPVNGRQAEMNAIYLLTHPDKIGVYLYEKRFAEVADLADYLKHDVPLELAQTDPALFRTLRKAVTELHVRGYGELNSQVLRRFAKHPPGSVRG